MNKAVAAAESWWACSSAPGNIARLLAWLLEVEDRDELPKKPDGDEVCVPQDREGIVQLLQKPWHWEGEWQAMLAEQGAGT